MWRKHGQMLWGSGCSVWKERDPEAESPLGSDQRVAPGPLPHPQMNKMGDGVHTAVG